MDTSIVADVLRDGVGVAIKLAAPMLLLSMLIGVVVALFQAVTQIHEQTISFILKLIIVIAVLLIGGGWMMETLQEYARSLFELMTA
ncbi:MAG: flagellar biosynthetic protein FliQ [Oscillospiraceae bacterium]|nr:flagellar biosynthetic protein FliQ [Oscillospiraceae bacterium]